jgi:hypothetical protein
MAMLRVMLTVLVSATPLWHIHIRILPQRAFLDGLYLRLILTVLFPGIRGMTEPVAAPMSATACRQLGILRGLLLPIT